MDLFFIYILISTILATTIISILFLKPNHHLPPSPPTLPIVGHLHLLSLPLHRTLLRLSRRYGPSLLLLRFGSRHILVVSSPSAVEECFTKNDITFANRPRLPNGKHISYNYTSLAAVSYGPLLRNLRRISITEIFSPSRIRSQGTVRQEEVRLMVKVLFVESCQQDHSVTHMSQFHSSITNLDNKGLGLSKSFQQDQSIGYSSDQSHNSITNLGNKELNLSRSCDQQDQSVTYNIGFTKVDMKVVFSELMFNVIMKIIAGKRYFGVNADSGPEEGKRFRGMIEELFDAVEASSPEDFLPFLKWFGFNGLEKRLVRLRKEMDGVFQELIEERRRRRGEKEESNTIIDVLLTLQEKEGGYYNDELIKGTILSLIAAGTHTTSAALEWAMSLLLNHPQSLRKLRNEIDSQVGQDRLINHSDLLNLSYLNNVIKETLRMFPTVPLLLPHESSKECSIQGFTIPTNTILFANLYSIHRDPGLWKEPNSFRPERFEDSGLSERKNIYIPFGMGRRSCPGEGLAMQIVNLGLGALIQCFEWERIGEEEVDMTEGAGIAMPKEKPLMAMYRPRKGVVDVLNRL